MLCKTLCLACRIFLFCIWGQQEKPMKLQKPNPEVTVMSHHWMYNMDWVFSKKYFTVRLIVIHSCTIAVMIAAAKTTMRKLWANMEKWRSLCDSGPASMRMMNAQKIVIKFSTSTEFRMTKVIKSGFGWTKIASGANWWEKKEQNYSAG